MITTYPPVAHRIPEPFRDKIELDKVVSQMREAKIVDYREWREAREQQALRRYSCQEMIKKQRGGTGGSLA